ncbi:hypothetical protein [Streptomyces rimosus]|uniref:hypothetical protein n=1 Tax=Streptomyces rimosus TaxID=1927 RepID=UPI000A80490B|nr:hypothetical protein [Streptomyces rimosus]
MPIWTRAAAHVRAHWRRLFLPAGFFLNVWGNRLYDTPHRTAGLVMFISGLTLAFSGQRAWRGITDTWRAPMRVRRWVGQKRNEPRWKRRWEHLKLAVWSVAVLAIVRHAWALLIDIEQAPDKVVKHVAYAQLLMGAWALLPLCGQAAEPKDIPTEELLSRLSARIWRAVLGRTVANASGIYFAGVVNHAYVITSRPSLLVPVAVTLGGAMVAAGHKTWSRLRKLSTQLHSHIVTLERDLAMIADSEEGKIHENQDAARRSWDAVQLDLLTPADTGYTMIGTPLLPAQKTNDLHERMEQAIHALPKDNTAAKDVLADLGKIREACSGRIDSVA